MLIPLTPQIKTLLESRGVESLHAPNAAISEDTEFEPPCSVKWMQLENHVKLGAFSYAVSGYYSEVTIGRYTSIGEEVQIGRSNHALTWATTSPFLYLREKIFNLGNDFLEADEYHKYLPPVRHGAKSTEFHHTVIGNDVYIGHGAFIKPGITVGDGAIVGAMSVVTKNVPPYAVVAGNPARLVRMRQPPHIIAGLLQSAWWRFAPWQLTHINFSSPEDSLQKLQFLDKDENPYLPKKFRLGDMASELA
jgi:acetyltransferase-like isoleucine patch superfamily enzyme